MASEAELESVEEDGWFGPAAVAHEMGTTRSSPVAPNEDAVRPRAMNNKPACDGPEKAGRARQVKPKKVKADERVMGVGCKSHFHSYLFSC
jgi:hypothetical protein